MAEYKVTVLKDGLLVFIGSTSGPDDSAVIWTDGDVRRIDIQATETIAIAPVQRRTD